MDIQHKYKFFVWVLLSIFLGSGEVVYAQTKILKGVKIWNKIKEATKSDLGNFVNEIFEDETFKQGMVGQDSAGVNINSSIRDSIISNNNKFIDGITIKDIKDAIFKNKNKNTSNTSNVVNAIPKTHEERKLDNASFEKIISSSVAASQRSDTSLDDLPDFDGCLVKGISIFNTNAPYQQIAQFKYIYENKKLLQISYSVPDVADTNKKQKRNENDLNETSFYFTYKDDRVHQCVNEKKQVLYEVFYSGNGKVSYVDYPMGLPLYPKPLKCKYWYDRDIIRELRFSDYNNTSTGRYRYTYNSNNDIEQSMSFLTNTMNYGTNIAFNYDDKNSLYKNMPDLVDRGFILPNFYGHIYSQIFGGKSIIPLLSNNNSKNVSYLPSNAVTSNMLIRYDYSLYNELSYPVQGKAITYDYRSSRIQIEYYCK